MPQSQIVKIFLICIVVCYVAFMVIFGSYASWRTKFIDLLIFFPGFGNVSSSIILLSCFSLIKWGNRSQIAKYNREKFQLHLLISASGPLQFTFAFYQYHQKEKNRGNCTKEKNRV